MQRGVNNNASNKATVADSGYFSLDSPAPEQDAGPLFQYAKEFPELQRLRQQVLLRERQKALARSRWVAWPRWSLLRIVLWKNLLIRRRRKSQFILLLFQIFLWFGIACFSIVFRNTRYYFPEQPYAKPTQLVPRIRPADLGLPIAVSYSPPDEALPGTQFDNATSTGWRPMLPAEKTVAEVMKRVLAYYALTYDGLQPPLRLYSNKSDLISRMTLDQRIPYGIHFDALPLDSLEGVARYQLVFWEKEVPTDETSFNAFDCRKMEPAIYYRPDSCAMALYGKHGFLFAQAAVNAAIMDVIAERTATSKTSLLPIYDKALRSSPATAARGNSKTTTSVPFSVFFQDRDQVHTSQVAAFFETRSASTIEQTSAHTPNPESWTRVLPPSRFRLELPSMSVVAEQYPEHEAVRSQAAEAAVNAPFYFMLALVSVFSFVVTDMVAEKESKVKEIMKTYGLSSGMFWLSWLVTYAVLNLVIVWCAVFLCTIGGVFGPITSIFIVASLFYLYILSLITFGFMVSVFFQKAHIASTAGMVFNLVLYVLGRIIHHARIANSVVRCFFMLFSTITFSLSIIDLISLLPDRGVTLIDVLDFDSPDQSIGLHLFFLAFDTLLYFVLAWYLDQVVQRDWGGTKHWTFVFGFVRERLSRCVCHVKKWFTKTRPAHDEEPLLIDALHSCAREATDSQADVEDASKNEFNSEWVEPVPQEVRARGIAVKIRNLVKRFPVKSKQPGLPDGTQSRTVVHNLCLDLYPGEVFGLLGHNGAGKTTTISMLTGMLQIDEGDALIYGKSIRYDSEQSRKLISICPQHNFFFEELTCLEHVIFFAALRGINVQEGLDLAASPAYFSDLIVQKRFLVEQREEIVNALVQMRGVTTESQRAAILEMEQHFSKFGLSLFADPDLNYVRHGGRTVLSASTWAGILALIEKVGLSEKMFYLPRMLSGGMKRRLWLAIALIGDPKVVFLDEPTSGVDPLGRQELWRLIEDEKASNRCIVVTTHHMEEADILADRKAILTAGRVRCVGSSLFLKSRFGIGYYLEIGLHQSIATRPAAVEDAARRILTLVTRHVPGGRRHLNDSKSTRLAVSDHDAAHAASKLKAENLIFSLPLASVTAFSHLFEELEEQKDSLGVREYGVSLTTLEEVFFRLGEQDQEGIDDSDVGSVPQPNEYERGADSGRTLENIVARERASVLHSDQSLPNQQVSASSPMQPESMARSNEEDGGASLSPHQPPFGENGDASDGIVSSTLPLSEAQHVSSRLKYGHPGDLVSQKFRRSSHGSWLAYFGAVTSLRWLQIVHNKTIFCVDVIFPVIMLLISLFFRDGGPGGLNTLVKRDSSASIPMYNYPRVLNTTIPYTVDSRLSTPALREAYGIIGALPQNVRQLFRRVDVLEDHSLDKLLEAAAVETGRATNASHADSSQPSLLQPTALYSVFDDDDDDIDDYQYEMELIRATGLNNTGTMVTDRVPLHISVRNTPLSGRALRNYLFVKRDKKEYKFSERYSAGFSFEPRTSAVMQKPGQNVWADGSALQVRIFYDAGVAHVLPILVSLLTDASVNFHLKESAFPKGTTANAEAANNSPRISTESVPLFVEIPTFVTSMTYGMYIMLTVGLSILPSRFGIQIMYDKAGGTKHAMIVMGLPFSYYWLGSFCMNYLAMLFGNGVMCVCIAYFIPLFWSFAIVPVIICALFYSASVLLYAYFLSQLFYNLKAYGMTLQLTGMFFALCPAYLVSVFADAAHSGARWSSLMFLTHAFSSFLLPPYNPIGVLTGCAVVMTSYQQKGLVPKLIDYFAWDRLPIWSIFGTIFQATVLFAATVYIDRRHYTGRRAQAAATDLLTAYYKRREARRQEWLRRVGGHQLLIPASLQDHKDEDVYSEEKECMKIMSVLDGQERAYAEATTEEDKQHLSNTFKWMAAEDPEFPSELPLVLIDDLHYMFMPTTREQLPHVAVRGFSLRVYRGDIFGLLGPNGAGKTTSLNLLTCHYMTAAPTRGRALVGGHDICVNPSLAFSHLGLCPQFDALWGDITVRDNIRIFARIKHVVKEELDCMVDGYIRDLDLETHQYKRISECSGGNKRRVSVAVAFIGNPDVVLMDEPSSGIDPVGRRRLAELIRKNAQSRCVVLTTHSMEEAEALCSKVGIIVNGELNCVNTSLAIRNRYGAGIRLEVLFDDQDSNYIPFDPSNVTSHPWQQFLYRHVSPNAKEVHRVANRVTYDLPLSYNSFGMLFGLMEEYKAQHAIKDYALSQPTLEQVFISFAKRQKSAQESIQEIFKD